MYFKAQQISSALDQKDDGFLPPFALPAGTKRYYCRDTIKFDQSGRSNSPVRRSGFTLIEMMIGLLVGSIIAVILLLLVVVTLHTWQTQQRQSEVSWRTRSLTASFSTDAQGALQVIYAGANKVNQPQPNPNNSSESFPAADTLIIFKIPSYDASGIIPLAYDYIGYGWTKPAKNPDPADPTTNGVITRTCFPSPGSVRGAGSTLGVGGVNIIIFNLQLHVSSQSSSRFRDSFNDPMPNLPSPFPFSDVDVVYMDCVASGTTLGVDLSQELRSTVRLRNSVMP